MLPASQRLLQATLCAALLACFASMSQSALAEEPLARWDLLAQEPDASMGLYAEHGSFMRVNDRGELSLRMVFKTSSRGQEDYQQIIAPQSLCAKGSGLIDRYSLDGQTYMGSAPATRPQANGKTKAGTRPGYDDVAAETLCSAWAASRATTNGRVKGKDEAQDEGPERKKLTSKPKGGEDVPDAVTQDAAFSGADSKPSLLDRVKSVFRP